jgi:UDP-glucose 4-epimerase
MIHVTNWIIGQGGLIGSALFRRLSDQHTAIFPTTKPPWADEAALSEYFERNASRFFQGPSLTQRQIYWAAGKVGPSSLPEEVRGERRAFEIFLDSLRRNCTGDPTTLLIASSAGGLYAGSDAPPHDEATDPQPVNAYGQLKLAQEEAARTLVNCGFHIVLARLSNVYGPGQDLDKLQGLVSLLCRSAVTRESVNIFVPLDTRRDYIFVDDASRYLTHWAQCPATKEPGVTIRIVASGQTISLASLIETTRSVSRVRIPFGTGNSPASVQAIDQQLIPSWDDETTQWLSTPLPAGIRQVFLDIARRHAEAQITSRSF